MTAGKEYQLAIKIAGKVSSSFNGAVGQAGTKLNNLGALAISRSISQGRPREELTWMS